MTASKDHITQAYAAIQSRSSVQPAIVPGLATAIAAQFSAPLDSPETPDDPIAALRLSTVEVQPSTARLPIEATSGMPSIFERIQNKAADHIMTTVMGTTVKFFLSETPAIVVKEFVVLAIKNEAEMLSTSQQYVTSHQHDDHNISSLIAWENSPLLNNEYDECLLVLAFINHVTLNPGIR
jgi:hypothetical protein